MAYFINQYVKVLFLLLLLLTMYYFLIENNQCKSLTNFKNFYPSLNGSGITKIFLAKPNITTFSSNYTNIIYNNFTDAITIITTVNETISTTSTARTSITIDPAELLVERPPSFSQHSNNVSNATLVVFVFHTRHFILANLQLYLIRKLARNLIAVELFLDGPASEEMDQIARLHKAGLHNFPPNMHKNGAGASERNSDVVNWALATKGKEYLRNGNAVLLLDGDVFPLSHFDSVTLLNSRDIICRKHPALYARSCWIGFICLAPQLYSTIDDFSVSQVTRGRRWYDAGGRTVEYLLKYKNTSFSWMKETILLENDKELFWGAIDNDITWIEQHFQRCDKCGPEIFFSPFNNSDAVFYHMISGTSEWRFGNQISRRQSLYDSIMQSPYGLNQTNEFHQQFSISKLTESVRKIQKMRLIPFHGNLTCRSICSG
jgi:hypothetical protein